MKQLIKRSMNNVDGWNYGLPTTIDFLCEDVDKKFENDEPITSDDVVEADEVYLSYFEYESLGVIDDNEIEILRKFNILK